MGFIIGIFVGYIITPPTRIPLSGLIAPATVCHKSTWSWGTYKLDECTLLLEKKDLGELGQFYVVEINGKKVLRKNEDYELFIISPIQ